MAVAPTPGHRVCVAVAHARADLASVADAAMWTLGGVEAGETLVELQALKAQLAELEGRVAAHAEELGVGQAAGASSTATWLAHETRQTRATTHRMVRLGRELQAHPATRDALAAAEVCAEQAAVILRWVDQLPGDLDPALVQRAESYLLERAEQHDAQALNRLGRRLWEVIAPEEADEREAAALEREERAALRAAYLTGYDDGHGKVHFKGILPTFHWAALTKALTAIAAAKHQNAVNGSGTGPESRGLALCEYIERYPANKLPNTGAVNATLVVTIGEDSLFGRLQRAGVLDTGDRISPGMARRLACEAGILPAVLGATSQVLDLGRERRLFSRAQRIALGLQQRGVCAADGCDRSTGLHAHHVITWADGGRTDLMNGLGLCGWHHAKAHDTSYDMRPGPAGRVTFHRRT